ncbi:MAG: transglutaminase domain-containing protein [Polyangiaceae bacterium]
MIGKRSRHSLLGFARTFVVAGGVILALTAPAAGLLAEDIPRSSALHEYIPPDPVEDAKMSTTTLVGDLPAAIETPSGIATAPDPTKPPDAKHLYGGGTTDDSPDSTYPPDVDTTQPQVENYEDPFSPSTSPFKRLRAFDSADENYLLHVASTKLEQVPENGDLADGDEPFYADFSVDLIPDQPVRIPAVGPNQRILKVHLNPEVDHTILRDGAENLFIRGAKQARVHVVMEIALPRAVFGSPIPDVTPHSLDRFVAEQPASHHAAAKRVLDVIGITGNESYSTQVRMLVDYFRAFEPSNDKPHENNNVYLDLALSKKGVCRHRAFAFLITALDLKIPTRMVVNEAHAWVEVFDGHLWHRIDLGGASLNLDTQPDLTRPQYAPPADPFAWPENSQQRSGQNLANQTRANNGGSSVLDPNGNGNDPGMAPLPRPATAPPTRASSRRRASRSSRSTSRSAAVRACTCGGRSRRRIRARTSAST